MVNPPRVGTVESKKKRKDIFLIYWISRKIEVTKEVWVQEGKEFLPFMLALNKMINNLKDLMKEEMMKSILQENLTTQMQ